MCKILFKYDENEGFEFTFQLCSDDSCHRLKHESVYDDELN